jgi:hypothetical protein
MRDGWADYVFAFHDDEEIGPRMLARIARATGLKPEDLWKRPTRCFDDRLKRSKRREAI